MLSSLDFKELLNLLEKYKVRYLIIGGYAVMKYSEPRFTKDIDLLISTELGNANSIYTALKEFGAPLHGLSVDDFTDREYYYQMGRPPLRIDIMMSIPGIDFEDAWKNREVIELNGTKVSFISKNDLIKAKIASGRPQDLIDVGKLKK